MLERKLITNFRFGASGQSQHMVVEDGRVHYRGPEAFDGETTQTIDLGNRFLLPALVECHCHILPTGLDLAKLHLGNCDTPSQVLDAVRDRDLSHPEGWLLAVHYDQNRWGGPHLTKFELDQISADRPILLRHVNGHAGIANSAALRAAGLAESSEDPAGGTYGRTSANEIDGTLFENGLNHVTGYCPKPTLEEMVEAILLAGRSMAAFGIGSASDMMTGSLSLTAELEAYKMAAKLGNPVLTRLYVQWRDIFGKRAVEDEILAAVSTDRYESDPVIAGIKIFADGAIGSATAAIYGEYSGAPAIGPRLSSPRPKLTKNGVSGQLIYEPNRLLEMVQKADAAGFQIAVHSIGDYATDLVLEAFGHTPKPSRHRLEHAMLLSDVQIEQLANVDPYVTMQPEFLSAFSRTYRGQLGATKASSLNRYRAVKDAGVRLSLSSDRPIVSGDPWLGMRLAAHRPDGFDQGENLSPLESLNGYLGVAADANGDAGILGRLEVGEVARVVIAEVDPLVHQPKAIESLQF